MNPPARLLVRGVNWLGDAVMTTPALLRLREALPDTHLALLTAAKLADLWHDHPALDSVVPFSPGESVLAVARRLRPLAFDTALILPNSTRAALECCLARIPRRWGHARPLRLGLLTDPVPPRPDSLRMRKPSLREIRRRLEGSAPKSDIPATAHHTLDYLHLVGHLGARTVPLPPRLHVDPSEIAVARQRFGIEEGPFWLGLNPGAEYGPAKRWPADRFAAVARELASVAPVRWLLLGGPADRGLTARIANEVPGSLDCAGRTTLRELMALLAGCRLLLTNDTGPMHLAAALGIPVVVPFGSTSPELTGPGVPGDPRHRLLRAGVACAPCFLRECPIDFRCLTGITTATVAAEILGILPSNPAPR